MYLFARLGRRLDAWVANRRDAVIYPTGNNPFPVEPITVDIVYEPPTAEPVVETLHRLWPIALMRLERNSALMEPFTQFMDNGWCLGHESNSIRLVDDLFAMSIVLGRAEITSARVVHMNDGNRLRVQTLITHSDVEYYGEQLLALYLPHDFLIGGTYPVNALVHGPTSATLDYLQRIAMRLGAHIRSMETDSHNGLLVLFTSAIPGLSSIEMLKNIG